MILEASFAAVTTYIAVGIAMALRGPVARKRKGEAFSTALMAAASGQAAPRKKLFLFRALMFVGIVLFWPVFWLDDRRVQKAG